MQGDTLTAPQRLVSMVTRVNRHFYSNIKDNRSHVLHPVTEPQMFTPLSPYTFHLP